MAHEELSPLNITPGAIRFNTDSMKLEYYRILKVVLLVLELLQQENGFRSQLIHQTFRLVELVVYYGGGYKSNRQNVEYINIDTTGNAIDFGNLTQAKILEVGAVASRTRGFILVETPNWFK